MYFTSALCLYRLNNLINSKKYDANKYAPLKWHIIEIFKHLVHKNMDDIKPNSNKSGLYCKKIISSLISVSREYEKVFSHCFKIIDILEYPTNDTIKRAKYNNELLRASTTYIRNEFQQAATI